MLSFKGYQGNYSPPRGSIDTAGTIGCQISNDSCNAYVGTPLSFCFYAAQNVGTVGHYLSLSPYFDIIYPGAVFSVNNQNPDSVIGCINYTPSAADTGTKIVFFSLQDSTYNVPNCDYLPPISVATNYLILTMNIQSTNSITEASKDASQITISPNPAKNFINIISKAQLYISLQSIEVKILDKKNNAKQLDVSLLANGIYFLKFEDEKGNYLNTLKFLKE